MAHYADPQVRPLSIVNALSIVDVLSGNFAVRKSRRSRWNHLSARSRRIRHRPNQMAGSPFSASDPAVPRVVELQTNPVALFCINKSMHVGMVAFILTSEHSRH